jgi:hypothetical protein
MESTPKKSRRTACATQVNADRQRRHDGALRWAPYLASILFGVAAIVAQVADVVRIFN